MREEPLVELGRALRAEGYAFVTVTPETHRRANANAVARGREATTLRDVLGWNRPFRAKALPRAILDLLRAAEAVEERDGRLVARVRFSTLGPHLFAHGAYPTRQADAVFFGPDTYRFCTLVACETSRAQRVVDVGCGSGAGGIVGAPYADRVVLADVNGAALALARVNAVLAGVHAEIVASDVLAAVDGVVDRVVSNPPYLVDPQGRAYRDGGGPLGSELSLRITREALSRLAPGGSLVLYTGAAVVEGVDTFRRAVLPLVREADASCTYTELDPDLFGEELDTPAYAAVDRIAAVALRVVMPGG